MSFPIARRVCALAALLVVSASPAAAQAPLAGLVGRVIQESTINRTSPGQPGGIHEPHFLVGESLAHSARQMTVELGAQLLSFPLGSSSGGFSFTTDSMTGEVSPSSETFGPAFAERAITIGRGQTNVGFAFRSTSYDSFEGVPLDSGELTFIRQHNDCCLAPGNPTQPTNFTPEFERDLLQSNLSVDISTRASVFFATHGLTDNFELGVAIPFVSVDVDARVDGQIHRTASSSNPRIHSFDGNGADRATFTESGSSSGLGDLSLRAKYNFLRGDTTSFAAGLDLRLPTGDKDDLLGTGATQAQLLFIYSGEYGRVSPHVNVGYTLSSGESSPAAGEIAVDAADHRTDTITGGLPVAAVDLTPPDEFAYTFGLNVAAHSHVTLGFDIKGRTLLDASRFELRDNVYPNRLPGTLPTGPFEARQEFSLRDETGTLHLVLGVIGAKFNVANTLLLNANVLFPMSDGGLKPKPTLVVGLDYVF